MPVQRWVTLSRGLLAAVRAMVVRITEPDGITARTITTDRDDITGMGTTLHTWSGTRPTILITIRTARASRSGSTPVSAIRTDTSEATTATLRATRTLTAMVTRPMGIRFLRRDKCARISFRRHSISALALRRRGEKRIEAIVESERARRDIEFPMCELG